MAPSPSKTYSNIRKKQYGIGERNVPTEGRALLEESTGNINYSDIRLMLNLCSLIYTVAEIRRIAREYNLKDDIQENSEAEVYQLMAGEYNFIGTDGKSTVTEQSGQVPANPLNSSLIEEVIERFPELDREFGSELTVGSIQRLKAIMEDEKGGKRQAFLNNLDASNNRHELVYGITALSVPRNVGSSQISVVFRGSVEPNDWWHNIQFPLIPVRVRLSKTQPSVAWLVEGLNYNKIQVDRKLAEDLQEALGDTPIRVHKGFLQYLFAEQKRNQLTKYTAIVQNLTMLLNHPKFKSNQLTVTGHSLGGALATVLSFFLACDKRIMDDRVARSKGRKYISCITFAAPSVGDAGFQRAFHVLQKRVKHLRITNNRDFVPLALPFPSYRHTGIQVHLNSCWWWKRKASVGTMKTQPEGKLWGLVTTVWPFVGCLFTTFPALFIPFYLATRSLVFGVLPLRYLGSLVLSPAAERLEASILGVLLGWQGIVLVSRKPLQVLFPPITHSLERYHMNLNEELLRSETFFE